MRLIDADHYSKRLVQASKYWNTSKADSHDKGVAQGLLEADEKIADEEVIQAIPIDKIDKAKTNIEIMLEQEKQKDGTYTDVGQGIAIALGLINNEIGE